MSAEKQFRVLVAEDNEDQRQLLQRMLPGALPEVEFVFVTNGQEVLDEYKRGRFDLLVLDGAMPIMSGFRAAEIIRADFHDQTTPIKFLTARDDLFSDARARLVEGEIVPKQEVRAFSRYFTEADILHKPNAAISLRETIARVLNLERGEEDHDAQK